MSSIIDIDTAPTTTPIITLTDVDPTVRPAAKVIHLKRFDNGNMTPAEYHSKHAFPKGARCCVCPRRPSMTIRVFMPLDELVKRDAEFIGRMVMNDPEALDKLCVHLTDGVYVRVSSILVCHECSPAAERAAAKGAPSWAYVEVAHGPDAPKLIVSG